jgi:hypothetical protein
MSWNDARVTRIGAMVSEVLELGEMTIARHRVPAGFDSSPHYRGLPDDMCPCEHWCYLARGELRYRFADGTQMTAAEGDGFHVRGGHLVDVLADAELIELTRSEQYRRKADHLARSAGPK